MAITVDSISGTLFGRRRSGPAASMDFAFAQNESSEQLIAQGLPQYTEMSRLGDGWTIQTATAFAPVAAVPSTTARLELFNNTAGASSKVMVVKDLFAFQLLSTAATQTYSIWAMVTTTKAAPTNTALDLCSLSGKPKITTTAASQVVSAVDTTVVANGWRPWGSVQAWGDAAATPGNAWSAPVDGALLVPPGASLCVVVAGSIATASSFHCGATFYMAAPGGLTLA